MEGVSERQIVEQYLKLHNLQDILDEVVNQVIDARPSNPYVAIARALEARTTAEIVSINLDPVIVSCSVSGVRATVTTNLDTFEGITAYPKEIPAGMDVMRDFTVVTEKLREAFKNVDPRDCSQVDEALTNVTGIDIQIGFAVSIACCRAGARHKGIPLYRYIAEIADNVNGIRIPMPSATVAARVVSHDNSQLFQRITLTPTDLSTYESCIESLLRATIAITKKFEELKIITNMNAGAPQVQHESLETLVNIIHSTVVEENIPGNLLPSIDLCMSSLMRLVEDANSSNATYFMDGTSSPAKQGNEVLEVISSIFRQVGLVGVEDPFHEGDLTSLRALNAKVQAMQSEARRSDSGAVPYAVSGVGGDPSCALEVVLDTACTDADFLSQCHEESVFNAVKVSLHKCVSFSQLMQLCRFARMKSVPIIVGCEEVSPETEDSFLADLAIGVGASQLAAGGLVTADGYNKFNRVLSIIKSDEYLQSTFLGKRFRMG